MVVRFGQDYLEQLYTTGKCKDKKHRYQPNVVNNYKKCVDYLMEFSGIEQLFPFRSLNYEVLKGDRKGVSSVRINDQYRLEFTVNEEGSEPVITVCTILDITNHYK